MFNKALLLSTTVLLTLIARGVNAEQCEGSNPNPTGQGFGAIYNAKAKWTGPPDQKMAVNGIIEGLACTDACFFDLVGPDCQGVEWDETSHTCTMWFGEGHFYDLTDGPTNSMIAVRNKACGQGDWIVGEYFGEFT